ncbi:MAG TPA: ATP-grasp domain-containing protein [archaeon]|nr:ATP-grasp domain-containing protein [archaeon]
MHILILSVEKQFEIQRIIEEAEKRGHSTVFMLLKKNLKIDYSKFDALLLRAIEGEIHVAQKIALSFFKRNKIVVDEKIAKKKNRTKLGNYILFKKAGLYVPETISFTKKNLEKILSFPSDEIVLKPMKGKRGKGIVKFSKKLLVKNAPKFFGKDFIAQEFADIKREYRVYVCGTKTFNGAEKVSASWIHNMSQGAKPRKIKLSSKVKKLALKASKAVQTEIAGVDIGVTSKGLFVIEVNRSPGFRFFESLGYNFAEKIVKYLEEKKSNSK